MTSLLIRYGTVTLCPFSTVSETQYNLISDFYALFRKTLNNQTHSSPDECEINCAMGLRADAV
jgi:hypothetical protein